MLDNVDDLIAALTDQPDVFERENKFAFLKADDIYCPVCGGPRRAAASLMFFQKDRRADWIFDETAQDESKSLIDRVAPVLIGFRCLQCSTRSTALLFKGPIGYELAVFPEVYGGLATPHTPEAVGYYLDQAKRAQSVGANSASVAMYRAALEHLLYEQGYTMKMLGPKLQALEKDIAEGMAKRWARDLKPEYLTVIKKLGDAAIHPGGGSADGQGALDNALLRQLEITFAELLAVVYEREHEEAERLDALKQALADVEEGSSSSARATSGGS